MTSDLAQVGRLWRPLTSTIEDICRTAGSKSNSQLYDIGTWLAQCCASVKDAGPALCQLCANVTVVLYGSERGNRWSHSPWWADPALWGYPWVGPVSNKLFCVKRKCQCNTYPYYRSWVIIQVDGSKKILAVILGLSSSRFCHLMCDRQSRLHKGVYKYYIF